MRPFLVFFFAVFFQGALAQHSYLPSTHILKKGGQQIFIGADTFSTTKNMNKDAEPRVLKDGESFQRHQVEVGGYFGATDELQLGIGARYRMHRAVFFDNLNEKHTASSDGLHSTFFSAHYGLKPVGRLQYTLEGLYRYTPYTNSKTTGLDENLVLGDEGDEYSFGLGITYASLTANYLTARGGFRSPGSEISKEIYWQAEGALAWRKVALVAGVDAVKSLNSDPYENDLTLKPAYNTGNSNLYNGLNREWVAPYVGANFLLTDSWRLELRGGQVTSGRSTDLGNFYSIQLVKRTDRNAIKRIDTKFKSYDIEASVTKVSPQKGYVNIDKGISDDVQKGMLFDLFEHDYVGGNILVARGSVIQAKSNSAIIKITNRFNSKKELKEGLLARAVLK